LDLELRLGYRGEDRDYSRAWREVGRLDHEEFSVGLRYERRFGADEDRVRYRQAILEQDRLEETAVQSERNWQIERLALVEDWLGRRADLAEQRALEEAYRSELESLQAEAKEGLLQARDLVDTQEDLRDAQVALVYARVDLIRAELRIHAHDDRLGERLLSP
jgi:outer membrane protein TolC